MPSPRLRFAGETAFLVLVALGLGLAHFDPIVIIGVIGVAFVLIALLERASSREAVRGASPLTEEEEPMPLRVEPIEAPPAAAPEPEEKLEVVREPEPQPEPEHQPEPVLAVSERSASALLATGPPPLPPEPAKPKPQRKPEQKRRPLLERKPKPKRARTPPPPPPEPDPVAEPAASEPAREWNLWELQRAVRDSGEGAHQEEWSALLIHLREFANADGDLPIEFDALVRESFGGLLEQQPEHATAS